MTPEHACARNRRWLMLLAVLVAVSGCRFAGREVKPVAQAHAEEDMAVTHNQIRLTMRAMVDPMCGLLEQSADQIIADSQDPRVHEAALRWKIEGVPALREALYQPDPLTAGADTLILCNQMADFFESGPGRSALREAAPRAVAACRRMEEELAEALAPLTVSGDLSTDRAYARQWAKEHPITHSIAGRESALSRVLDRDASGSFSAGEAVADLTTAVDDLNRRLEVYTDQLVRQARWEAQLFTAELLRDLPLNQALPLAERAVQSAEQAAAGVAHLAPSVERAVGLVEDAPKLIAAERALAIEAVQDELTRTIEFAEGERLAVLQQLSQERVAALEDLRQILAEQRAALVAEVERITFKTVDHTLWRVAQLAAVVLVALFLGMVLLLLVARRLF